MRLQRGRATAAVAAGLLLSGIALTAAIAGGPEDLPRPQRLADGSVLLGYRLSERRVAVGERVDVTLYLARPPRGRFRPQFSLVHPGDVGHPDPVTALARRRPSAGDGRIVTVPLVPFVQPGPWKLTIDGGRPFGLLQVTP